MKFSRRYLIPRATSNNSMSKEWISVGRLSLFSLSCEAWFIPPHPEERHDSVDPRFARRHEETEMNYASTAHESRFFPPRPVHLLFRDLYYGNSARTTSRLTFDNNAGASEKAACRGGGAVATGVATRPGEPLSGEAHRWTRNSSAYLSPPRFRRAARCVASSRACPDRRNPSELTTVSC